MELNQKRNFKQELIVSLAASAFLALTVFIFGPVQVYLPNSVSFPYMFNEVLLKFLPVALVALLLLTAILASIPGKFNLHRKLAALMVGGSVLLWLQGNIILWNYGVLDGSDIKWGELHLRGIIDGLIWLVVLALVFFKWEQVYKYAKKISIFFILIQLLYTVALFFQYPAAGNVKNFTLLDDTNQFGFSSKRNIIVLIVDGFQSDLFQELTDEDPDYKKKLDGFTYYRNALAG
ncbi:MAG: hypothetical protein GY940_45920, partial [bacterium]|nr:hypothetical protein [bacterium]